MPTNHPMRRRLAGLVAVLSAPMLPQVADAHQKSRDGAPARPEIASVHCDPSAPHDAGCPEGQFLAVRGERLGDVTRVVFLGGRGPQDDRHVHPRARSPHRVLVRVPTHARSGRLRAVSRAGRSSRGGPPVTIASSTPAQPEAGQGTDDGVFPLRGGRYDFGTAGNAFGGGRGHQGQDIFAACGTPVAAARVGTVMTVRARGNEGNYSVIEAPDGTQQAYLHLLEPAAVSVGDQIAAGQPIGKVGQTGNAAGCHLHFELWSAPGRFTGGSAYDPRPDLDRWAAGGLG